MNLIDLALRRVSREGLPRVLNGESWGWAVAAGAAFLMYRARQRQAPVVSSVELEAGERYLVTLAKPK